MSDIRPLALVVFRRPDGCILVARGFDRFKGQRFYRPIGGGIEFGELAEEAARREVMEEIGAEIEGLSFLATFENLFVFEGRAGHELVWMYEAAFVDPAYYAREHVVAQESGNSFPVEWVPLRLFTAAEAPLYPEGLLEILVAAE
jgi:8-oxo-dGTP pyrophosphatase MutT (NUDIX family)